MPSAATVSQCQAQHPRSCCVRSPVNHLLKAGIIGEKDYLTGVAENIIVGQPISLGTGSVALSTSRKSEIPTEKHMWRMEEKKWI